MFRSFRTLFDVPEYEYLAVKLRETIMFRRFSPPRQFTMVIARRLKFPNLFKSTFSCTRMSRENADLSK